MAHYFNPSVSLGDKIGLAGSTYELTQSLPILLKYFGPDESSQKQKWADIAAHEEKLQTILLDFLSSRKEIKIYGEPSPDQSLRVPTVSFTVEGRSSKKVVEDIEASSDFGFRFGHFYSKRLVDEVLGLGEVDGLIRVSLVHYNSGTFFEKEALCLFFFLPTAPLPFSPFFAFSFFFHRDNTPNRSKLIYPLIKNLEGEVTRFVTRLKEYIDQSGQA